MYAEEDNTKRPSSCPGLASPLRRSCLVTDDNAITASNHSRQILVTELPSLQRAQTIPIAHSLDTISEYPSRSKKPSFKIAFPSQQPSMLPPSPSTDLPVGHQALGNLHHPIAVVQQPLLPTLLSTFHLTPPAEELSVSPFEQLLSLPRAFASPNPPEIKRMASTESRDQNSVSSISHALGDGINESSALDLSSIASFATNELAKVQMPATAMSMVHQPLPFPLPQRLSANNPSIPTLFPELLNTLRSDHRLPATGIRILHALTDKLPSDHLPTSPPVTPSHLYRNSIQQAQGYFTIKPIYPSIAGASGLVVPPGESLISITERIIPPSAEFETSSFLSNAVDSGFCERISELSPGGLFILVLPTQAGGHTFHRTHLSSLLDPILRNVSCRIGLRSQLSVDISNAVALKQLESFEAMQTKIENLLIEAKHSIPSSTVSPEYKLIAGQKGTVQLPFEAWYALWLGQERSRIMGLLNYHLNVQGQGTVSSSVTRSSIMLEIEEAMKKTGLARGHVEAGIELGVYIIQRTR